MNKLLNILKTLWPKPHNRNAAMIISGGIALAAAPPFFEKILSAILKKTIDLSITDYDQYVGVFLIILGVIYHVVMTRILTPKNESNVNWKVYEVAFLWHGQQPPPVQDHFNQMSPDIAQRKEALHNAINQGLLKTCNQIINQNGGTRWVSKKALMDYCKLTSQDIPKFLN